MRTALGGVVPVPESCKTTPIAVADFAQIESRTITFSMRSDGGPSGWQRNCGDLIVDAIAGLNEARRRMREPEPPPIYFYRPAEYAALVRALQERST